MTTSVFFPSGLYYAWILPRKRKCKLALYLCSLYMKLEEGTNWKSTVGSLLLAWSSSGFYISVWTRSSLCTQQQQSITECKSSEEKFNEDAWLCFGPVLLQFVNLRACEQQRLEGKLQQLERSTSVRANINTQRCSLPAKPNKNKIKSQQNTCNIRSQQKPESSLLLNDVNDVGLDKVKRQQW